uniref:Hexosyltransferase n=1 Tax=Anopheles christyi TaxID=43041 RepID=A0A182JRX3_9DIPT
MFERRPVLGVLGCLTLVLTIWQISPRDVTVYREATSPYLPSGLSPLSSSAAVSSAKQTDQQKLPYDSDENNAIDALPPYSGFASRELNGNGGTSGTYLTNQTSPGWLVAAAVAAVAESPAGPRTVTPSRSQWNGRGRLPGREEVELAVSRQAPTASSSGSGSSSSSSTQSTASLTLASSWGDTLPNDDYTSLIDLKDFKFTINHDYCGTRTAMAGSSRRRRSLKRADALWGTRSPGTASPPLVLVLIHSAPANLAKRNTIRATWGQPEARARLIFLMGAVNTSASQRAIERESRLHDDIVQGNFVDAYRNMTYKHVMALKWFVYHCPGAQYVLKTDDDVFINTPILYNALQRVVPQRNLLLCQLVTKLSVKRTHRSKWFVSWREYPARYYPPHCPGYSILYSPDVAWQLYREAQRQPFFWIDDVHITGTVAQQVNVTITPMDGLYLDSEAKSDLLSHRVDASRTVFFFTNPNLSMDEIERLWETVRPRR